MKHWNDCTKKELLALPKRKWDETSTYDSVLLVSTRRKHDSGYNYFAVVGVDEKGTPVEIAAFMDDFRYINDFFSADRVPPALGFAFDCSMAGVFRLHSNYYKICVGCETSTTFLSFRLRALNNETI